MMNLVDKDWVRLLSMAYSGARWRPRFKSDVAFVKRVQSQFMAGKSEAEIAEIDAIVVEMNRPHPPRKPPETSLGADADASYEQVVAKITAFGIPAAVPKDSNSSDWIEIDLGNGVRKRVRKG